MFGWENQVRLYREPMEMVEKHIQQREPPAQRQWGRKIWRVFGQSSVVNLESQWEAVGNETKKMETLNKRNKTKQN